jgi:hypothetical protein
MDETEVEVKMPHRFIRRSYQKPLREYMVKENALTKKFKDRRAGKRAIIVWHRRTGKDKTCVADHIFPAMFERVGAYHYYFPSAADGRAILWDGMDRDGMPFLDHLPEELIESKNNQEMKIKTKNGSLFQIIGTDRMERVGTNPVGCVFSEFSKQNPKWWDLVRPILAENAGWAIFNWTPRGKNHAYRLDRMAQNNDAWFYQRLTADMTGAIEMSAIEADRDSGMSEEMVQQEYYCSYELGVEGSYYGRLMGWLWQNGRVCSVPYDDAALVNTAWDLGYGDSTAIWFFQVIGREVHLIDYYENFGEGIKHYKEILLEKKENDGYLYGKHFAPHDVHKHSLQTAETLLDAAKKLGINFVALEREKEVDVGIQRTRSMLKQCWFDSRRCEHGINCLENYRKPYNEINNVYGMKPIHDWTSHGADAFRYLSAAIGNVVGAGMTAQQAEEIWDRHRRPY